MSGFFNFLNPLSYHEPLFRPPQEADSLFLQPVIGCPHNRCSFCQMYKQKQFKIRPITQLLAEIKQLAKYADKRRANRIFLADASALAVGFDYLSQLLKAIYRDIPNVTRVGSYTNTADLLKYDSNQLLSLESQGLKILYLGLESGDDQVLQRINKGNSAAECVSAGQQIRAAGIKLSVTAIIGLENDRLELTADALIKMQPNYTNILTLMTEFEGRSSIPEVEFLQKTRILLNRLRGLRTVFLANHISNPRPLKLRLPSQLDYGLELLKDENL